MQRIVALLAGGAVVDLMIIELNSLKAERIPTRVVNSAITLAFPTSAMAPRVNKLPLMYWGIVEMHKHSSVQISINHRPKILRTH